MHQAMRLSFVSNAQHTEQPHCLNSRVDQILWHELRHGGGGSGVSVRGLQRKMRLYKF